MLSVSQKFQRALGKRDFHQIREIFLESQQLDEQIMDVLKDKNFESLIKIYLGTNQIQNLYRFDKSHFPSLQILDLKANQISSLQGLGRCQFPNLKILNLKSNKLMSLKGFKSMDCPNLQKIVLYRNLIKSMSRDLYMVNNPKLQEFILEYSNNRVMDNDARGIVKTNFPLKLFLCKSLFRIKKESIYNGIKGKYFNIKLQFI